MTPDEAIAHAQSETARADRERARRIAAEEERDRYVARNRELEQRLAEVRRVVK